jgi:nucleotide-binding universal stress UspA family protein
MDVIVVGVDGSANAARALRWALDHASGAHVVVVGAWSVPASAFGGAGYVVPINPADFEAVARESLERAVADVTASYSGPVDIEQRTIEGGAAQVLLEEARRLGATMLVVGSRGHGGFAGLLLGSVSASLAHHTPCPLVIVPAEQAAAS